MCTFCHYTSFVDFYFMIIIQFYKKKQKKVRSWIISILVSLEELYLWWTMLFIMVLIRPACYVLIKFSGAFHLKCCSLTSPLSLTAHSYTHARIYARCFCARCEWKNKKHVFHLVINLCSNQNVKIELQFPWDVFCDYCYYTHSSKTHTHLHLHPPLLMIHSMLFWTLNTTQIELAVTIPIFFLLNKNVTLCCLSP